MPRAYRDARAAGWSRRESIRVTILLARLWLNDPPIEACGDFNAPELRESR